MDKILISGCLYGWKCRYDGKDSPILDARIKKWKEEGRLIAICPEEFGGLKTPRPPSQRIKDKIVTCNGCDVTLEYMKGAREALRLAKKNNVVCCIMKEKSPSCGSKFIYDGTFTNKIIKGKGCTSELLHNAGFTVFNENEIDEAEKIIKI